MRLARRVVRPLQIVAFTLCSVSLPAQTGVGLNVEEVVDNRLNEGVLFGSLQIQVTLTGPKLDRAAGARVLVKEARDDKGTALFTEKPKDPDFTARDMNGGRLSISLPNPSRAASSVRVAGTIELFVPSKDPNAVVKVPKALSKLDTPLSAPGLKAAKVELTPISPKKYAEQREKQKLTPEKIEALKAEGKKHGADEKEIEMAIEFAKAMEALGDNGPPEGAVVFSCKSDDADLIQNIRLLRADGEEIPVGQKSSSTSGDDTVMVLYPNGGAPPADTAVEVTLLTAKSRVSFPFELKNVRLP